MRIQHNITAMNSYRNLSANQSKLNKNLEKLSTGYKVNRAADDAAGLAISEKMRAQISGLEQATKNAKDGSSLIQTAEGALTEVHDMLNRMVTLAEQSANGTYDDSVDRYQLQKEVDALKSEIDRVAESTNYNGIKLLDGSLSGKGNIDGNVTVTDIPATQEIAGTNVFTNQTGLANGDKIAYTVTWNDENNESKSTTVELEVVNAIGSDTAATALRGSFNAMYNLTTAGTAALTEILNAVVQELNKDDTFKSYFTASANQTANTFGQTPNPGNGTGSVVNSLTITSKTAGTKGGYVTGVQAQFYDKEADGSYNRKLIGGGSSVSAREKATDAAQELGLTNIRVLDKGDYAKTDGTIEKNIFTVAGKRFALYGADQASEIQQLKDAVGEDVTFIQLTSDSNKAGNKVYELADDDTDTKIIAGEISRVTRSNFTFRGNKVVTGEGTKLQSAKGKALMLQVGDTSDDYNRVGVNVGDMHVDALGLKDVDISDQDGAAAAVSIIKNAVNTVSDTRGGLGALQNRLDHTINNLGVMRENIQSAEGLIRDTDVAEEMMTYTKNNILNQSAQAMLAQANQLPQGVLQLLG